MNRSVATDLFSRRQFVIAAASAGAGAAVLGLLPARFAQANPAALDEAIRRVIGDRQPEDGAEVLTLDLPQIAENGNTVPIGISVDSPMTADEYVKAVHVFAEGNPLPDVASFHFGPKSGVAQASTRMRLAKTQNVVAIAEMSDGKVYGTRAEVKVTIGGCGG